MTGSGCHNFTGVCGLLWKAGGGTVGQIQIRVQASWDGKGHVLPVAEPVQATCSTKTLPSHAKLLNWYSSSQNTHGIKHPSEFLFCSSALLQWRQTGVSAIYVECHVSPQADLTRM